ncbi:MAG: MobH family relaxase [Thioalkalivibrio sp.]
MRSLGRTRKPTGAPHPNAQKSPLIPIQDSDTLLHPLHRRATLAQIAVLTTLPAQHYEALVLTAIRHYACFVQQLPASEAHHHAGLGGMLDHGLEVLLQALLIRRGRLLPVGGTPERIAQNQDVWTYAVATAALLHDIGKPAVDQQVSLYDVQGHALGRWEPWLGPMTTVDGCQRYSLAFRRGRKYRFHEQAAPLLAHQIIPARGIAWLARDHELFSAWLATIAGNMDEAGALGEIILQADGLSVARNLGAGDAVSPAASGGRSKPLWTRLLTGLRYLLDQGELPLNRNGAAGWLVGDDLWLVSKRTVDALRAHLGAEGHAGIPASNDRIYDTLQEHGVLVACGDRAIWRATVASGDWSHELTLIRIPVHRLWPQADARPVPFEGTVTPLVDDTRTASVEQDDSEQVTSPANQTPTQATPLTEADADPAADDMPMPPGSDASESTPEEVTAVPDERSTTASSQPPFSAQSEDEGCRFMAWLINEVAHRRLSINQSAARLHVVDEGLLLVSPGIFKDYVSKVATDNSWEYVQKRFLKLKQNVKCDNGTNIHRYAIQGDRHTSHIKGVLIPAELIFGSDPPAINHHLRAANAN